MQTLNTIALLRTHLRQARKENKRIAFVPTMGNLHQGHLSLIEKAKEHGDIIVCSIFVNPMQFGANEDLDAYPRTLNEDQKKLAAVGTHILFAPNASEMYPNGLQSQTIVSLPFLSNKLCGKSRPGHFEGVATVVSKLFNIVQPDVAIFGEKDFQQVMVIKQMVADLNMSIDIISVATARETSGLALSSRNGYLNQEQKELAQTIYQTLEVTQEAIKKGERCIETLSLHAQKRLEEKGLEIDYLALCNTQNLETAEDFSKGLVMLIAVYMGNTRLIDNKVLI